MFFLTLCIGLLPPTLSGWLLLRCLEGTHPVLFRYERWVLGFLFGLTLSLFLTFLASLTPLVALTRWGFLSIQLALLVVSIGMALVYRKRWTGVIPSAAASRPFPAPLRMIAVILGAWVTVKMVVAGTLLIVSPIYADDVFNKWNLIGKIYVETQEITLGYEAGAIAEDGGGVFSYPPTVSLAKAHLSALHGSWSDPLTSAIHLLWFLTVPVLLFFLLRRSVSCGWAVLGVYLYLSLPLIMMHATIQYADVFLSAHLLAAIGFPFLALSGGGTSRMACFRLGAAAAGLLVFTKNEALILHLPALLLVLALVLWILYKQGAMNIRQIRTIAIWYVACIGAIVVPWLLFKWWNGLAFGNAKSAGGLLSALAWQRDVLHSIWINTFFEGNWIFLFPLFIGVLIVGRRFAFATALLLPVAFVLIVYLGQIPLYLFTPLSVEATMQTGYARGIIQLAPLIVLVTTILLAKLMRKKI